MNTILYIEFFSSISDILEFIELNKYKIKRIDKLYYFFITDIDDEFLTLLKVKFGKQVYTYNDICNDPSLAYRYSYNILKGRFPDGEKAIADSSYYSYHYAVSHLKERFILGETAIKSSFILWETYIHFFGVDR